MKKQPILSIIIAAHDNQGTIAKCINSFYSKVTGLPIEIICIDDHCTDKTIDIVQRFKNIKVFRATDHGLGSSRNAGIVHARGMYLWFIDADDTLDTTALNGNFLQDLCANQPDMVVLGVRKVYKNKRTEIKNRVTRLYNLTSGEDVSQVFQENILNNSWNKLYRWEIIEHHQLVFTTFPGVEDLIFNCDYLPFVKSVQTCGQVFYNYYVYSQTSTKGHWYPDQLHNSKIMLERLKMAARQTPLISTTNVMTNGIDSVIGNELNYYSRYQPSLHDFRKFVKRSQVRNFLAGKRSVRQLSTAYLVKYLIARSWLLSYFYMKRLVNP